MKNTIKEERPNQKTVCNLTLPLQPDKKVVAAFDGGRITSDAGLLLFHALDRQQRFTEEFASCIDDGRDGRYVQHWMEELIAQRCHQIIAGYEDCNDADSLRSDPSFKLVCNRRPEQDPDLASQSTLSRLENRVSRKDLRRIGEWMVDRYLKRCQKRKPKKILLDLDSTDDPTHGRQQLTFFHGYYDHYMYHPLLIFDGETGDLVCAVLRPGNRGAAAGVVAVLKRVIRKIRQVLGRKVPIEIRADSGFATPQLYTFCEAERLDYVIGFARNPRLERAVESLVEEAQQRYFQSQEKQRCFTELSYQADSWDQPRRLIAKVEVHELGVNRRFVVTNRPGLKPQALYDGYVQRGQTENYLKAFKQDLAMDRLSCHRFLANQFRLLLHALAYLMFLSLRDYLQGTPWKKLEIETLRRRLLKVGARIRETTRRIWIHFASSYPEQDYFHLLLRRLGYT